MREPVHAPGPGLDVTSTVASMRTRRLRADLRRPWGPDVPAINVIVVDLETTDGRRSSGFSWSPRVGPGAIETLLNEDIAPLVVGGPVHPEVVFDHLWDSLHEGGSGGLTTMAIAAIDIALWDLRARSAECSLVDLLGRRHDRVEAYGSGVNLHYRHDDLVAQARRWVADGFGGAKMKVGRPDLSDDDGRVAAVRDVLGGNRRLMIDANQRWDLPTARRAIDRLARHELFWVEEPLRADDLSAHADLRRSVDAPIAVGENLYTVHRFREYLDAGACDIVQPNVVRVGGITPFMRIATLARAYDAGLAPHLLPDISAQLAQALEPRCLVEVVEDATFDDLGLVSEGVLDVAEGQVTTDTGPGHGLTFVATSPTPIDHHPSRTNHEESRHGRD